jgi:hypothetical protein
MATKNETKKEQEQQKPAPRGEKVSTSFKNTIKAYLDKRAAEDTLFAQTYAKENKNLDECCNYILQEVKKSGCCGFDDDEIYNMAIHYYDEDDIKDVKPVSAKVVVNHTVELSDEEKAEAKEKAKADYEKEQLAKLKEEERKREEKERKAKEERIRKQKEAEERQKSLQLSLFDMM